MPPSVSEYWIGQGVNFSGVWAAYEQGLVYADKFRSKKVHLIRFRFEQDLRLPLFDHEAIFKTFKGYFHELKKVCLSEEEYIDAIPLFLYGISRGSTVWEFLGELRQLVMFGTTLADQKMLGQELDNYEKKLKILRENFSGAVHPEDFERFMKAKTPRKVTAAVQKMIQRGLNKIEISKTPFQGAVGSTNQEMVDLTDI